MPVASDKRPAAVTGLGLGQFLLGLFCFCICACMLTLVRSPEMKQGGQEGAATIRWLTIGVGVVGPATLLALLSAYGLLKNKLWGWWVALVVDLSLSVIFVYSAIANRWNDLGSDMFTLTIMLIVPVLMLWPPVRRLYWARAEVHSTVHRG